MSIPGVLPGPKVPRDPATDGWRTPVRARRTLWFVKPGKVVALIVGILLVLPGIAMLLGGAGLTIAYGVARDDDGYFDFDLDRLQTPTAAIVSGDIDFFSEPGEPDWVIDFLDLDVRIAADSVDDGELFVGIGPTADVDAYLDGVAHDEVTDLDDGAPDYRRTDGDRQPAPPGEQTFWAEQSSGIDPVLEWEADDGEWTIVLMNADGSVGVASDVEVGAKSGLVLAVAIGMLVGGLVLLGLGVFLVVVAFRRPGGAAPLDAPPHEAVAGAEELDTTRQHPVALSARLDPDLSRWMWLVKWFLAIPHFIVLVFLWIAFVVLTVVAFFAILFTRRYPRGMFDFNVGVLRWTWRVTYYAYGALGTDRYPPFSLGAEPDYPATLDIARPEHLSRGLVLVKSWLLAIPHYVVLGIIGGGYLGTWDADNAAAGWPGLLSFLVFVAAVVLLFAGRYPKGVFEFVMGLNRWVYRVIAYVTLMTDDYPPFRLDQGGDEPAAPTPTPPGDGSPAAQKVPVDA